MTTPAAAPQDVLAAIRERVERSRQKLRALCEGTESFTMSVPARVEDDHDIVFSDTFGDVFTLLAHIDALAAEVARCRSQLDAIAKLQRYDVELEICQWYGGASTENLEREDGYWLSYYDVCAILNEWATAALGART